MTNIEKQRPTKLGYYRVRLKTGCELHKLYGTRTITARYIERTQKNGTHQFFDLPRPGRGVEAWELICEN